MKNFIDRFVSPREEAAGEGEGGGAGAAAGGGVDVAALQKELADTKAAGEKTAKELSDAKTALGEKDQAVQYWHGKATSKGERAVAAAEPADDTDLLDVIAKQGTKGLDEVLKKRGYVSKSEVEGLINGTVDRVTREGKAVERFPELKDASSDFYKQTAKNVAALKAQGITGVNATEIAAERAYLQFLDEGKIKPAAQRKAEATAAEEAGEEETEAERIARGAAAGGATGRRASSRETRPVETAADKALIARVCEGMGITEKQWRDQAEKGINYRE